jgi:hypothetical protein
MRRAKGQGEAVMTETAARKLLAVIDALTAGDSGSFIDYRAGSLPW